ncbi:MAG TPA: acetyl-coenzyme A synthetase, partial [Pelagibacterium sp.]|nr:acetyl-coenzyme A synthetase [Pelagibacterium sp.]
MSSEVFAPSEEVVAKTSVTAEQYDRMYQRSVSDPDGFWGEHALRIDWIKPFTKVKNTSFEWPDISIKWFED